MHDATHTPKAQRETRTKVAALHFNPESVSWAAQSKQEDHREIIKRVRARPRTAVYRIPQSTTNKKKKTAPVRKKKKRQEEKAARPDAVEFFHPTGQ